MFNSINFGNTKYNSRLIREAVAPVQPPSGGQAPSRGRRGRLLKREFIPIVGKKLISDKRLFNIIGTKLIFERQPIDIIAFILLPQEATIDLKAEPITKTLQEITVRGCVSYPVKTEERICGKVKFPQKDFYIFVKGKRLICAKQLHLLHGQKSIIQYHFIKGSRKIYCRQNNLIRGQKDITEILKALDMLDTEE